MYCQQERSLRHGRAQKFHSTIAANHSRFLTCFLLRLIDLIRNVASLTRCVSQLYSRVANFRNAPNRKQLNDFDTLNTLHTLFINQDTKLKTRFGTIWQ